MPLLYTDAMRGPNRTIIAVRTESGSFSFQPVDLASDPLLVPELGFFVADAAARTTAREFCAQLQATFPRRPCRVSPRLLCMPLQDLRLWATPVRDLRPLRGMPLRMLDVTATQVTNLGPLKGAPLVEMWFSPSSLMKGTELLRDVKSLQLIAGARADQFWRWYDSGMGGPLPRVVPYPPLPY